MLPVIVGCAQQGSGGPALAITMGDPPGPIVIEGVIGEDFPISTNAGDIDVRAIASGGDGSYSYAWSITEQGDDDNINTGNIRVTDAGTTNQDQYNDSILTGFDTGLSGGPPIEAMYYYACTITDGTGASVSDNVRVSVLLVAEI